MKIDKVISTIENYRMLEKGDRVAVGFSGGADSVCLLHILNMLKERYELELVACHVNHMLRGEEADRDEQFCKDFCNKHGIKLEVLRVDVARIAKQNKQSVELCARKLRYDFFESCLSGKGKIATAHTLSDSLETAVFNMLRGTALKGLCSIPEKRDKIIRPLIECTRCDVEEYCKENNLYFVTDSTNNADEYSRNRIRHHIIPQMQMESNSLYTSYYSMHKAISRDEEFLEDYTDRILEKIKLKDGYDAKLLAAEHDSIIIRCIAKLFSEYGVPVDTAKLELVCSAVKNGGQVTLMPDLYLTVRNSVLTIQEQAPQKYFETPLLLGAEIEPFEGKTLVAQLENYTSSKNVNQKLLKKYIDYDKIGHAVVVRQRKDGESVRLASNKMTKTLKKLFNEHKISPHLRDRILIISDENGIVWIEGFGAAERCSVDENTKRVVTIEVKRQDSTK